MSSRPRLVLLHGFTQTGRSWDTVAADLGADLEVLTPDAPGHGDSTNPTTGLWHAAESITALCGRATYVGYSMGGRIALHAALARPDLVERLVLLGATPGIRDTREREARRQSDEALALSIERDGVDAFLTRWLSNPLFEHLPTEASQQEDRRRNSVDGLSGSLRTCGTGSQDNLWTRLAELQMPVLLMAGALDTKFAELALEMAPIVGGPATTVLLDGAGHAAHLEKPQAFIAALREWLQRTA